MKRSGTPRRRAALNRSPWIRSSAPWPRRSKAKLPERARPDEPLATWCEAKTPACVGRAVHRHHKQGRIGPDADGRDHTLDVCAPCHQYIHANPAESYKRGWLLRRVH